MIWTECPRCQGEVGNWCGGNCHEGGLYICEHCGNAEEENSEECPCCGRIDEDMRVERLKAESENGNQESAAELYALESGDHDKAALRQAFLAGVRWVGESTVNAELLEAARLQERHEWAKRNLESIGADPLNPDRLALVMEVERTGHDANVARKAVIAKAEGGNQ